MRTLYKFLVFLLVFIASPVAIQTLLAQAPPPSAAPIDGLSGAAIVVTIGAGLALRRYFKKDR